MNPKHSKPGAIRFGFRILPAVLSMLIIFCIVAAAQYILNFFMLQNRAEQELSAHVHTVIDQLDALDNREQLLFDSGMNFDIFCMDFVVNGIGSDTENVEYAIAQVNSILDADTRFFYTDAAGVPFDPAAAPFSYDLSPEDRAALFSPDGGDIYVDDYYHYVSRPFRNGYLVSETVRCMAIFGWSDDFRKDTGESLLILTPDGSIDTEKCNVAREFSPEELQLFVRQADQPGLQTDLEADLVFVSRTNPSGEIVVSCRSLKNFAREAFDLIAFALILFGIVAVSLLFYTLKLSRRRELAGKPVHTFHVFKRFYFDRSLASHVSALLVIAMLFTGGLYLYVDILSFMSSFHTAVADNDTEIDALMNLYDEINAENTYIYESQCKNIAGLLCWELESEGDTINTEELQAIRDRYPSVLEIAFYDRNGYLTASDKGYSGYKLEYVEGQPETECLRLLKGDNDVVISPVPHSSRRYIAVRRRDGKGFVRIFVDAIENAWVDSGTSEKLIGSLTYFSYGNKYYCYFSEFGELICEKVVPDVEVRPYAMISPGVLNSDRYALAFVDGELQYYHTRRNATTTVVLAKPFYTYILANDLPIQLTMLVGYFLLWIAYICSNGIFKADKDQVSETGDSFISRVIGKDKHLSSHFSKAVQSLVNRLIFVAIGLLFAAYIIYRDRSLIMFLLGSEWERGVNIFSITNVIWLFVLEQVVCTLVCRIILLVANNMNAKGRTIGKMFASSLHFLLFLAFVFYSLILFGVNITTLLTGAGIAGAALSFCAQSTIADIIAGMFIIFEGHIRVGDWVAVGDVRGEVTEIGMRASIIAYGTSFVVVNNSKLTNIQKLSPAVSGPVIAVSVDYAEDIDHVIDVLNENQSLYRSEIPQITSGPVVLGVADLGDSGITVKIAAKCDLEAVGAVEVNMRRITKRIFDQNNITIPWPQLVVHTGSSVQKIDDPKAK